MLKWNLWSHITSLVLILFLQMSQAEVTLRVLLRPPMVTLECLILNVMEKSSVLMMCPNDVMCFKNCTPLCDRNCSVNAIKCSMSNMGVRIKYTYTFDTSNSRNQGEWTCHFGNQQSSTVIIFNDTNRETTLTNLQTKNVTTMRSTTKMLYSSNSKSPTLVSKKIKGSSLPNFQYVIVLIVLFVLSLSLNIALITRNVQYNLSSKKSIISIRANRRSCLTDLCIKIFCVEEYYKEKPHKIDSKEMLPRQFSNNIYECTPSTHLPPAIVLDNYAFVGTPTNQRWFTSNMQDRSQSFSSKPGEQLLGGGIRPSTLFTYPQIQQMIKRQESANQMVYDDVAEQSMCYAPVNYFNQIAMQNRPSQYMSMNSNLDGRIPPMGTMSMNNLATTGYRLSDVASNDDNVDGDTILKDAINSRVELSKEMINQADTLLKRADSLLNDKDKQNTSLNNCVSFP